MPILRSLETLQNAAVATGNGAVCQVLGCSVIGLQVTIATTATITFEASVDATTWVSVVAANASSGASATTATATGTYIANVGGFQLFRARISAWTSGAVTVTALAGADVSGRVTAVGPVADLATAVGHPLLIAGQSGAGAVNVFRTSSADGQTAAAALLAALAYYNGATVDRARGVHAIVLLASASRTVTTNSADMVNYNHRGFLLTVDVSIVGTGSITPTIQTKDSISANYKTIWTAAAALTGNGTAVYAFYPGSPAIGTLTYTELVSAFVGRTWRLAMTANNANAVTYSASADMLL